MPTEDKLYGIILSPNVQRPLLVAYETRFAIELVNVSLSTGEHKQPPFLQKNPFGEIPVLETAVATLWESRAIARYIDITTGGKLSHISNHAVYGLVETWSNVENSQFNPTAFALLYEVLFGPILAGSTPRADVVADHKKKLQEKLAVYEKHLTTHAYLAGAEYSLADLFHVPVLTMLAKVTYTEIFDTLPHVKKWYETITARPASVKLIKEVFDAFEAVKASKK